jgi:hypothetical protein
LCLICLSLESRSHEKIVVQYHFPGTCMTVCSYVVFSHGSR